MSCIETEIKYLLSRSDFHRLYYYLQRHYSLSDRVKQTNYYFDTHDLRLLDDHINIRIRKIERSAELTLKAPVSGNSNPYTSSNIEYNYPITLETADLMIQQGISYTQLKNFLGNDVTVKQGIKIAHIRCFGSLTTLRCSFIIKDNMEPLLLDVSRYLGISDFEVEWELTSTDMANSILIDIFNRLRIKPIQPMVSKKKRFFDRLSTELSNNL